MSAAQGCFETLYADARRTNSVGTVHSYQSLLPLGTFLVTGFQFEARSHLPKCTY